MAYCHVLPVELISASAIRQFRRCLCQDCTAVVPSGAQLHLLEARKELPEDARCTGRNHCCDTHLKRVVALFWLIASDVL